ncbi:hypothetical protein BH10ACT9_BH10ACT9_33850 [soil metagenome]
MTLALGATGSASQFDCSIRLMRRVIPAVGCGLPAVALDDPATAAWVRSHGVTVTAHGDDELDLAQFNGIRPVQIVFRCDAAVEAIRRAARLGVSRFVVATPPQMARLAECAQQTKYVYLDDQAPLLLGDRTLRVIGLHCDVDDSGGAVEWASAVERLLCRAALLKTCGWSIRRIALSGGPIQMWCSDPASELMSIVHAVDDAMRDGCERWQLTRPSVSLSPLTVIPGAAAA